MSLETWTMQLLLSLTIKEEIEEERQYLRRSSKLKKLKILSIKNSWNLVSLIVKTINRNLCINNYFR